MGQLDICKPGHGGDTFLLGLWGRSCYTPEATMVSPRVQAYNEAMPDQLRRGDVDLIDERRW
jgi:hypothetical protein